MMIRQSGRLFRSLIGPDKTRYCSSAPNMSPNTDDADEEMRDKILDASLAHVPQLGWTHEAIRAGVEDLGYPRSLTGIIPSPGIELIHHHVESSNLKIESLLQKSLKEDPAKNSKALLRKSIETRLRMNIPYASKWPEAIALMTVESPCKSFEHGLNLMDIIWNGVGDKSVDLSWYSKRLSLGLLYKSAEVAMITDKSPDYVDTWEFLDRRLNEYNNLGKMAESVNSIPSVFSGVASTLVNIVGLRK